MHHYKAAIRPSKADGAMIKDSKFREIPYNYTSFSDREIVLKYYDEETWGMLDQLRSHRVTGRSARLLFEIYGDIFIIDRNPYLYDDYLYNPRKRKRLRRLHEMRLRAVEEGALGNQLVLDLVKKTRVRGNEFFDELGGARRRRARIQSVLSHATSRANIHFTPFHRVSHATDASDWRVEYPSVVVYPSRAREVPHIVRAARRLGLSIIPRGGGTGLTAGAVPVRKGTLVLNTERLNRIEGIEFMDIAGSRVPVVNVEAGAVTEDVMEYCAERGYIFATDPTSAWASTIGGNIAENAGGKKCVMWGTAIDNLLSFRIVTADGSLVEVARRDHAYRKIEPGDRVIFDVSVVKRRGQRERLRTVELSGTDVRKKGLGKDITNKALGGLPGLQKEGGDGVIVSASFVLYKPFHYCRTVCLEFYGNNMINASKAIVDIIEHFSENDRVYLTALEHFDDKYVRAINYKNKSKRNEVPKAVLIIDIESNIEALLNAATVRTIALVREYNTEGFIASTPAHRENFWKDRKNLGAIARHTNAFKLNEDIVIPIEQLPQFADFIDKLNLLKELSNSAQIVADVEAMLTAAGDTDDADEFLRARIDEYRAHATAVRTTYLRYAENMNQTACDVLTDDPALSAERRSVFRLLQDGVIRVDYECDVAEPFRRSFHNYDELMRAFDAAADTQRKRKIIIATHMHAGDGNVHVNIPVHSNDYLMMAEADATVGVIMEEVVRLGGVVSGEHGIGLTKLRFVDQGILDGYAAYKRENDPDDLFNPGKLNAAFPLSTIYTPSFNLLKLEAFILKATDLEGLSTSIASCVRCGKCKGTCNTHHPGRTMFYNPRNKILGVGLIIEAVLYEAQMSKSLNFRHFAQLIEIANYCTMCHRCAIPCPVKIDFGDITLNMREILTERRVSRVKTLTALSLFYLMRKGYYINKLFRVLMFRIGYRMQNAAYYAVKPARRVIRAIVPTIAALVRTRLPAAGQKTFKEHIGVTRKNAFIIIQNPTRSSGKSVFYFPGCGSERLFPDISIASQALLFAAGVRVVMPPEYLCCGYPVLANGKSQSAAIKSYENRVIFHTIADVANYLEIDNVVVSCGTCFEMLQGYEVENIFNGARLIDINEFLAREGFFESAPRTDGVVYYHDPCHTPLKQLGYQKVISSLTGERVVNIPYCCGEGGTLALSTPEISNQIRDRKRRCVGDAVLGKEVTILTTCPSCVQGLSRINGEVAVTGMALPVHLAERFLGPDWKKDYLAAMNDRSIERVLY
ncbi:MAG TPA: DUF3683 domain-containing protein [Spirochaetota bacterium]|nr:DUF3683 domain-containing protein [Spirochaetota bacterium]